VIRGITRNIERRIPGIREDVGTKRIQRARGVTMTTIDGIGIGIIMIGIITISGITDRNSENGGAAGIPLMGSDLLTRIAGMVDGSPEIPVTRA